MNMNRPVYLAAPPEQITQRQMNFSGIPIHVGHSGEDLNGLIRLFINQIVQTFEVVGTAQRRPAALDFGPPGGPPTRSGGHWQQQPQ